VTCSWLVNEETREETKTSRGEVESRRRGTKRLVKKFHSIGGILTLPGASFDIIAANGGMTERECWDKSYSLNVVSTNFFTKRFVPLLLSKLAPGRVSMPPIE
jgi:hypothetical protein